jgi:CRISPR/Cas system CSM-associated protein Csm3 (group 7 of RAMP superfamily)
VTIEFVTPFLIGAGESDQLHDDVFQADANGLPCIPGASLAGVLRHALAGGEDPSKAEACKRLFGYQQADDGEASHVRISFGHLHDASDRPVPARGAKSDPVLAFIQAGISRDHVRIGMHGVVDGRGKFDQLVVPTGARFTFEVSVSHASGSRFADILALLARAELRLGRRSRSGLGRFRLVRASVATFDLGQEADIRRLARVPVALHELAACTEFKPVELPRGEETGQWVHGEVVLSPIGTWVIGRGVESGREPDSGRDRPWGRLPVTESILEWEGASGAQKGRVMPKRDAAFLVPGSSVKGALRHRTAFHIRRLKGEWLVPGDQEPGATQEEVALFGEMRSGQEGRPGRVYISDVYVDAATKYVAQHHVSLDRFTQGPMDHLLFDELSLGDCTIKLDVSVHMDVGIDGTARRALVAALEDLCAGRLALGAGRGHGRFKGTLTWNSGANWLEAGI